MKRIGMIEGLEGRRLMSGSAPSDVNAVTWNATTITRDANTAVTAGGSDEVLVRSTPDFVFNPPAAGTGVELTEEGAQRDGLTLIRFGDDTGTFVAGGAYSGTRVGLFSLPTIRADGTSRVAGTAGDDVILVEAVTGFDESAPDNEPTDNEFEFLNLIDPTTGERYVMTGHEVSGLQRQIDTLSGFIEDDQGWLDAFNDPGEAALRPSRAEQIAELEASIAARTAQVARLEAARSLVEDGQFVRYTLDGVYDYYVEVAAAGAAMPRVTVDAGAGSDSVTIATNVAMKATLYGGSGGDTLTTGKKSSMVYGGGGKDRLISRSTKGATLDGGQSADRYYNNAATEVQVMGRADGDVVVYVGGTTSVARTALLSAASTAGSRLPTIRIFIADDDGTMNWRTLDLAAIA